MDRKPARKNITLSCIVITANRRAQLAQCLASIHEQQYPHFEVIVVDNASKDDTCAFVRKHYADDRLICNSANRGVSGGRNDGIRAASGELFVFIDDDAVFENSRAFVEIAKNLKDKQLGVLAFKIVNRQTGQMFKHEYPVTGWGKREFYKPFEVAYFVGCGFAVRKAVFDEAGLFTENMMYGPEEVDLSYRVIAAGYRLIYCPAITVLHMATPTQRRQGIWFYNSMRSRFVLALRNLPVWALVSYLAIWAATLGVNALYSGAFRSYLSGLRDGIKMIPVLLRERNVISLQVARKVARLGGRLFY